MADLYLKEAGTKWILVLIKQIEKALPKKTSQLENDSGFITEETDPTVPEWAKQETKPTYTADEVGALAKDGNAVSATKATQDGNGNVIADTYALLSSILSAGIDSEYIGDNLIPTKLSFENLISKKTVTFFTTTVDSNFPSNYGTGIMTPQANSDYRTILYIASGHIYWGDVRLSTSDVTWKEIALNSYVESNYLPLTGNATSATKLQTARKINGVSFDGTSDINLPSSRRWFVGSNSANTSGWYKFLTVTLGVNESTHFVLSVTNMYANLSHGIVWISLRGNGSPATLETNESYINWMYRSGFSADDIVAVANSDSTVDFYIRQPRSQYGSIMFQVISEGVRTGNVTYTTYAYGGTPVTKPTATITSKDGGTVLRATQDGSGNVITDTYQKKGTVVWENADVNTLDATTISVSTSGYSKYEVLYFGKQSYSGDSLQKNVYSSGLIPIGRPTSIEYISSDGTKFLHYSRALKVEENTIDFKIGYQHLEGSSLTSSSIYAVPYQVILYP